MATYTDAKLSNFPDKIDDLPRLSDVSANTIGKMNQYNSLMASGNFTGANEILDDELAQCLFTADTYNKLRDAIIAVERSFKDDVSEIIGIAGDINDSTTNDATKKVTTYSSYKIDELLENLVDNNTVAVIDATSADYDMDVIFKSGAHRKWYLTNNLTLGTPFAKGKTTLKSSLILSFTSSTTYGQQIAFSSGGIIWIRKLNNGKISEWSEIYSALNKPTPADIGAAPAVHTHEYLPLTGGAKMIGGIYKDRDNSNMTVGGGTAFANGASVTLYGKNSASYTGAFLLKANNGTTSKNLYGYPNGTLTWDGDDIYTAGNKPTPADIGAAAASHNHSASNISSGTLAVGRGGTGVTSNPSMLTDLGSTKAANVFAASPRPGVTGVLSAANGGTGQKTLKDSLNSLINSLELGNSAPKDTDYFISQYVSGNEEGTTATTKNDYYRRPFSYLWNYIKSKADSVYLKLTGGTLTGALYTSSNIYKSKDNSYLLLGGGSATANGSSLYLYGKDHTSYPGAFILKANNGTTTKNLYGTSNGTLNWDSKAVYTQHNITNGTADMTAKTSKLETGHIYLQYE